MEIGKGKPEILLRAEFYNLLYVPFFKFGNLRAK